MARATRRRPRPHAHPPTSTFHHPIFAPAPPAPPALSPPAPATSTTSPPLPTLTRARQSGGGGGGAAGPVIGVIVALAVVGGAVYWYTKVLYLPWLPLLCYPYYGSLSTGTPRCGPSREGRGWSPVHPGSKPHFTQAVTPAASRLYLGCTPESQARASLPPSAACHLPRCGARLRGRARRPLLRRRRRHRRRRRRLPTCRRDGRRRRTRLLVPRPVGKWLGSG